MVECDHETCDFKSRRFEKKNPGVKARAGSATLLLEVASHDTQSVLPTSHFVARKHVSSATDDSAMARV
jgi:hypothetical protein